MITTEEKFGMFTNIIYKALKLKESGEHHIFVEWIPHVDWLKVIIYNGPWKMNKESKIFMIEFQYVSSARRTYKKVMDYLNNLEKTSESEAQNG